MSKEQKEVAELLLSRIKQAATYDDTWRAVDAYRTFMQVTRDLSAAELSQVSGGAGNAGLSF